MTRIESLLRKAIGLDAASIGSSMIQRTVRLRMKQLGLSKIEDYERLVQSSSTALADLIEAVVVTETWFFRDREPFTAFAQMATQWLAQHSAGTLRALSIPCSSGEEPYSLAMALLDVPVLPHRFLVDGVDISQRALERARHAVYGRNSFRGKDLSFRERHFRHTRAGYVLNPIVRQCVHFHQENLLDEGFLANSPPYDFIFCRNLLIYFDRATQVLALEKLHHLLSADGVLFVGPAELPLVTGHGFVSAQLPMTFACRKMTTRAVTSSSPRSPSRSSVRSKSDTAQRAASQQADAPAAGLPARSSTGVHRTPAPPNELEAARQLADAGRHEDAVALCEAHLRRYGPSAQAYYLLGLLSDARGDANASDYYRKALYLEPNHYETLLHMTLLLEKNGDSAGASTLRQRLKRATNQQERTLDQATRVAGGKPA